MKISYLLAGLLTLVAHSAHAELYFLEDNTGNYYQINSTTGAASLLTTITEVTSSTIGLTEGPAGTMYGSTYQDLISFNADGTGVTTIGPSDAEALAYCSSSNILYSMINDSFSIVNQATGTQTPLAAGSGDIEGLACDNTNNVIYGLSTQGTDTLYRYTPGTDTWAAVGATGVDSDSVGLAMDSSAGILYAMGNGNLYRLSTSTGAATLVGASGVGGGGLAFAGSSAPPTTPTSIPTLSEWGMIILSSLLALGTILTLRRQRH